MKTLVVALGFIQIVVAVTAAGAVPVDRWTNRNAWGLRQNMADSHVRRMLGEPVDKEGTSRVMIWYYQDPLTRVGGKVTDRPECGLVRVKATGGAGSPFAVFDWKVPDWERVEAQAALKAAQAQEAQRRIADERAEQTRLARERFALQAQEREDRVEVLRKGPVARPVTRRAAVPAAVKEESGFETKYWFIMSGMFIVTALAIALFGKSQLGQ